MKDKGNLADVIAEAKAEAVATGRKELEQEKAELKQAQELARNEWELKKALEEKYLNVTKEQLRVDRETFLKEDETRKQALNDHRQQVEEELENARLKNETDLEDYRQEVKTDVDAYRQQVMDELEEQRKNAETDLTFNRHQARTAIEAAKEAWEKEVAERQEALHSQQTGHDGSKG